MRLLLTGASGSFGTAFLAHAFQHGLVDKAVAFARGEHRLAELADRLGHPPNLKLMVGDVRDAERVHEAMGRIDTVVHCSALKRTDAINHDPWEILRTNVEGTRNVVRAAVYRNVPRVLVISSDKAAAPSTMYGTSKLAAEFYAIHANAWGHPQSRVACTRWGNVLGSQGSVVPVWRRQIARGEPITLTDERMVRFWATMDQVVMFTLTALREMRGGDILIPDLPAATLLSLARAMAPGHPIKVTGMRAGGEKISEMLVSDDEAPRAVRVPGLGFVLAPTIAPWPYRAWGGGEQIAGAVRSDSARMLTEQELRAMLSTLNERGA